MVLDRMVLNLIRAETVYNQAGEALPEAIECTCSMYDTETTQQCLDVGSAIHIDCETTCGSGAEVVEQFNSGWLGLIAILVGAVILVCLCRRSLNLCSKCCSEKAEESNAGLDRSTLFANDCTDHEMF